MLATLILAEKAGQCLVEGLDTMNIREALEEFYFHNKQHSEQTQVWYKSRMDEFASWCEKQGYRQVEQITAKIIRRYIDEVSIRPNYHNGKPLSSYTVHSHARTIRRFFNWMADEDNFQDLISPKIGRKIPMPKIQVKVIETFTKDEIQRMFTACEDNIYPVLIARNKAILAVLLDTGLRAGELCGLKLSDVYIAPGESFICVLGKGSKEREVGLGVKSSALLSDYIEHYRAASLDEPHVFLTHKHEPLNRNGLDQMLHRLAKRAGVKHVHPHKWRHTFAVQYLLQGGDVYMLSKLLGHTSIDITQVYVQTVKSQQARKLSKSVVDQL